MRSKISEAMNTLTKNARLVFKKMIKKRQKQTPKSKAMKGKVGDTVNEKTDNFSCGFTNTT